ncbi:hypothetical protein BX666DRAFT_1861342 [Dichotomocladium elegans]|nr:hypothetical protein BX666DRAFT_1861342 [Dichotomocladium elegans]
MTFSRMENALEDAFVEWINTFDGKSSTIDTIVELADGTVLSEILIDISSSSSSSSGNNSDSSWVVRLNNQKRIHKLITRYFDEVLGQDPELLPVVDLTAIAKEAKHHELLRMCQLVVAIAVQSDNNRVYIDMIQSLSQKSQHALMLSIEEASRKQKMTDSKKNATHLVFSQGKSGNDRILRTFLFPCSDMPYRYQIEFDRLIAEKKYAEATHTQLLIEYDHLRDKFVCTYRNTSVRGRSNIDFLYFIRTHFCQKNAI